MRNKYTKITSILHFTGKILLYFSFLILIPIIFIIIDPNSKGTAPAFIIPAIISLLAGLILVKIFKDNGIDLTSSMLLCAIAWISISMVGALPYMLAIDASFIDGFFEAMSGFTTTGITVFNGLDSMPQTILFWRSITQWLGGLGVLSLFLLVLFNTGGSHHIFGAESHKISSSRITPGLFNTVKSLWIIYGILTMAAALTYFLEGMTIFDAVNHALTTLSTGGFSPHDASIDFYRQTGKHNFRLIEYTVTFFMLLGGINFLVHYRILKGDFKAFWDTEEIRTWWKVLLIFIFLIMLNHFYKNTGIDFFRESGIKTILLKLEEVFRYTIFQVMALITTTGYGTKDIGAPYFPALAKQLFLIMMVIGGCVGSTAGGIKITRIVILKKLVNREIFKLRFDNRTLSKIKLDGVLLSDDEVFRTAALFFYWMFLLLVGGAITAMFSNLTGWQAFSGMFSALGNIGPCYISVPEMINLSPLVKLTYIIGMLAGRLEILPVLLLFTRKAWI
ncbi:MAG: TrkH family potassium uptake protein [Fidelibacterota bacterium]